MKRFKWVDELKLSITYTNLSDNGNDVYEHWDISTDIYAHPLLAFFRWVGYTGRLI